MKRSCIRSAVLIVLFFLFQGVCLSADGLVRLSTSGARVVGPVPLPTKIERFTVRRSAFIDKDSHEHFEIRTHNRIIDVLEPDSKTIDMLMRLSLPAGVDIEIKI